MTIVQNLDQLK